MAKDSVGKEKGFPKNYGRNKMEKVYGKISFSRKKRVGPGRKGCLNVISCSESFIDDQESSSEDAFELHKRREFSRR